MTSPLDLSVQSLHGVGPRKVDALRALGVRTIEDLLFYFPRRYEDRRYITPLRDLEINTIVAVIAEVFSVTVSTTTTMTGKRTPCSAILTDGENTVRAVWFNPYATRALRPGMRLALYGRVEFYGGIQLNNPKFEILAPGQTECSLIGRILPVYTSTSKLPKKFLTNLIQQVLENYSGYLVDFLPESIRERYGMKGLKEAVLEVHNPKSYDSQIRARNRLAFDELFLLQVGLLIRRRRILEALADTPHLEPFQPGEFYSRFREQLPFTPTHAQLRAIDEILSDLRGTFPMNRLLQGDVGSGKTFVAVSALLVAVDSGFQGAFMAPTSILAQQHFIKISELLTPLGVKVSLLTGGLRAAERREVLKSIRDGDAQIVIGTHALLSECTDFKRLGLVVVDEQHRFGVMQRSALVSKGVSPHALIMTATPIPRTLVLSVYGDLTVSILDEMPPGRKLVKTIALPPPREHLALEHVRERIQLGQQVYWVCPLIDPNDLDVSHGTSDPEEITVDDSNAPDSRDSKEYKEKDNEIFDSETDELSAVTSRFEELSCIFPEFTVAMLHGRLPINEKAEIMRRFSNGEIDLLVATIVIEVGVDVPNATLMVIEDAGRFGLAQLHQLRGRVGRGTEESECLLLYGNALTQNGYQRISNMVRISDGFSLAESDLQLRGPGALCGVRQHGVSDFRVADLARDLKILELARRVAQDFLSRDPELEHEPALREELTRRFGEGLELAGIA